MTTKNYWNELDLPSDWSKRERFNYIMAYIDSIFDSSDGQEEETPTPTPTPTPEPEVQTGSVSISIYDIDDVKIADANITLTNDDHTYTGTTDEEGECTISDIVYGDYTFTIQADGYEPYEGLIQIIADEDSTEVLMDKIEEVGDVKITVTDGENPIESASVSITDTDFTATTGRAGGCTIRNVPLGQYTIEASKEGYITGLEDLTVNVGENPITITLELDIGEL